MGTVVLDASVVLALFDPTDVHHAAAVGSVRRSRDRGDALSVPVSVLAEVLVGSARQGRGFVDVRRRLVVDAFGPVRIVDDVVAVEAAVLRAEHPSLRLPDALVLATGRVDAATVLTADHAWRRFGDRVTVVG